ncbi:hypothetical protein J7L85_00555 [candidate division WOR-3 bacterium]|nr:hypothetical protein [candidate division WOR-3 bacterium]
MARKAQVEAKVILKARMGGKFYISVIEFYFNNSFIKDMNLTQEDLVSEFNPVEFYKKKDGYYLHFAVIGTEGNIDRKIVAKKEMIWGQIKKIIDARGGRKNGN